MDAGLQERAERLAREMADGISTQQELSALLRLLSKTMIERMLDAEMNVHLGRSTRSADGDPPCGEARFSEAPTVREVAAPASTAPARPGNRRNGRSCKTIQGESGEATISTPRDRDGTFEPLLIPKYERRLAGFDQKILALYAKGMSTRDIQALLKELYDVELSPALISSVTETVGQEAAAWRSRPLAPVWPIVYFDGIVVYVRGANGRVSQHTIYVALGVNLEGRKELLGLWLGETEGAKFWLGVLTDLKNRGLQDIFVACVDGLTGFPDAIRAVFERGARVPRARRRARRGSVRRRRGCGRTRRT